MAKNKQSRRTMLQSPEPKALESILEAGLSFINFHTSVAHCSLANKLINSQT
jgi:hypothetical protein